MTVVLDASAVLAYLGREPGADRVEAALMEGAVIGAANWSEVAQKVTAGGADWVVARAILDSFPLRVEPVIAVDAESAAALWQRGSGLSLGDRLCLALARRLGVAALTADSAWPAEVAEQIR